MRSEPKRSPAYAALADGLRESIRSGQYADGRRMPTEAELAQQHEVSRQTVRRAMQQLVSEGLVYRVAGRGTFPVQAGDRFIRQLGSIEDLLALRHDTESEVVTPLHQRVDIENASRLRLPSDDVMSLTLVRFHAGEPMAVTTAYFSVELGRRVADVAEFTEVGRRRSFTVFGTIEQETGITIDSAEQSLTAATASPEIAELLQVLSGSPVLRADRLYLDRDGEPVELAISYFNPQLYSYRTRLRRHPGS